MHFRGNHFCIVVFQTHYSIKFTPQLDQLRKTALKLRMTKIPKSSLGQLTTTHPAFLPILREVIREIYQFLIPSLKVLFIYYKSDSNLHTNIFQMKRLKLQVTCSFYAF